MIERTATSKPRQKDAMPHKLASFPQFDAFTSPNEGEDRHYVLARMAVLQALMRGQRSKLFWCAGQDDEIVQAGGSRRSRERSISQGVGPRQNRAFATLAQAYLRQPLGDGRSGYVHRAATWGWQDLSLGSATVIYHSAIAPRRSSALPENSTTLFTTARFLGRSSILQSER